MMKQISLNDYLNSENLWSKRLLGLTDFSKKRDINQVEKEYNLDKYAKLLEFDFPTMEDYRIKEFELSGLNSKSSVAISYGDTMYSTPLLNARTLFCEMIKSKIEQYHSRNICELGCGYGYNLNYLEKNTYGGEYSKNAVILGKKLGLEISEFNYYKREDYNLIKPDSTIFTVHSIEQIPDASVIIDALLAQGNKINYVVHFEPTQVKERTGKLGLYRNKYIELNDYNRNLIELLVKNPSVEIIEMQYDVFGLNPLNSSNLIVWKSIKKISS